MPLRNGMLCLAIFQTFHSIEEYRYSLWEVLEPARLASGFVSDDLATGFAILNALIVTFAFATYFFPVVHDWVSANIFLWFWTTLELVNGIVHIALAILAKGYFPGVYTAPLLLAAACYVGFNLLNGRHPPPGA